MDSSELIKLAESKGWTVRRTKGDHIQLKNPNGTGIVHASSTPGDHRAANNLASNLRRAGLDIPHRGGK